MTESCLISILFVLVVTKKVDASIASKLDSESRILDFTESRQIMKSATYLTPP